MRTALSDQFVLCWYVARNLALPPTAAGLIPVRAQIVLRPAGRQGDPKGPTGLSAQVNAGTAGHGLSRGGMGTRGMRSARVLLGMLPPGASVAGAVGGVVDPGDGYNGRVVRVAPGDRLIFPASALFGPQTAGTDEDLVLSISAIACDGTAWVGEGTL